MKSCEGACCTGSLLPKHVAITGYGYNNKYITRQQDATLILTCPSQQVVSASVFQTAQGNCMGRATMVLGQQSTGTRGGGCKLLLLYAYNAAVHVKRRKWANMGPLCGQDEMPLNNSRF